MKRAFKELINGLNEFVNTPQHPKDYMYYLVYDQTGNILKTVMEIDDLLLDEGEQVLKVDKETYELPGLFTHYHVQDLKVIKKPRITKTKYLNPSPTGKFNTTKDNMLFLTNEDGDKYE